MIENVIVLGGGSAGFIAALTLKLKLPQLTVRVIRSPDIGVIGVGEGTTSSFPRHFFEYLRLNPKEFYQLAEPTWKLGLKFIWGPRQDFYYTFSKEYEHRWPELKRGVGFYHDDETHWVGPTSALLAQGKVFPRQPDGSPNFKVNHAFHIENVKLVAYLETLCRRAGVEIIDGNVTGTETGPVRCAGHEEKGVTALVLENGERLTADLYVDASGFRSELLGKALDEPYQSYDRSLFCDRAVIGGWARTDEHLHACTTAETMDAGWCWQIEHEHWINRGYVYSSQFISDEAALAEFLRKNPKVSNEPRIVKFRTGRRARTWVGNVVGMGNSVGFVEPLEATSIQVICTEASSLADSLADSLCEPTPSIQTIYNQFNGKAWDDIRDFLAVHYKFNTRLDTPFWQACRNDTDLMGAAPVVEWYRENGPSTLVKGILIQEMNPFGFEGFIALLVGMKVPHGKPHHPSPTDLKAWRDRSNAYEVAAKKAMTVAEALGSLRKAGVMGAGKIS